MSRYVIGDIHGSLDKLKKLLEIIHYDKRYDEIIFLGDYIDRGQDSKGVLELLIKMVEENPRIKCLVGNHEDMFLDYLVDGEFRDSFLLNGGIKTLRDYGLETNDRGDIIKEAEIPQSHVDFIKKMPLYHEDSYHVFVHAGLDPDLSLQDQDWGSKDHLWIRSVFINSGKYFGKRVIFGHTKFVRPYVDAYKVGIDTGAYTQNGVLTALRLDDYKFFNTSFQNFGSAAI